MVVEITGKDDEFVQLKFDDGVRIINSVVDGEKNDLFIKGGHRSMFMFRQIRNTDGFETYLVTDLNANNVTGFIENLKKDLETEVNKRKENDTKLTGQIDDIYTKLSGVINYHGVLSVGFDYANDGIESGFTKLFRKNDYDVNDPLSAGWFYRIKSDSDHHMIDSVKIGDGDFLKIENDVLVGNITSADVIVVDTLDKDTAHFDDLKKLSNSLTEKIDTNTNNIENNLSLISELSDDVKTNYFNKTSADDQVVLTKTSFKDDVTVNNLEVSGTFKALGEEAGVIVTELSAEDGIITNLSVDAGNFHYTDLGKTAKKVREELDSGIKSVESKVDGLSEDYHGFYDNTFTRVDVDEYEGCGVSCDSLMLTDEVVSEDGHGTHDRYRMAFRDGTIVLIKEIH